VLRSATTKYPAVHLNFRTLVKRIHHAPLHMQLFETLLPGSCHAAIRKLAHRYTRVAISGGAAVAGTGSDPTVSCATVLGAIPGSGLWSGHISDLMIRDIDLLASAAAAERARRDAFLASANGIG
jgi:hypothetical protein